MPQHAARTLPPNMADRLIVALDVPTIDQARELVARIGDAASFYKVGYWLLYSPGVDGLLAELKAAGKRIFLDAKLHDISQTVEIGAARAAERGVDLLTVHAEPAVMAAAVKGAAGSAMMVFGVTVLTSLDDADLTDIGYRMGVSELVALRARQAAQAGCAGIIASPQDSPAGLRAAAGAPHLLIATPGVRPLGDEAGDQKRVATPYAAIAAGADYLVVGRPVVAKPDPAAAARAIAAEMEQARIGNAAR
ncbi:MAG: orotidine-5'-phosphate decarboxylase [Acetobacteraceae bacterium]|nr:orotidine-5'-phosphate decarboxylase [Acetobacteraceae bacterium]